MSASHPLYKSLRGMYRLIIKVSTSLPLIMAIYIASELIAAGLFSLVEHEQHLPFVHAYYWAGVVSSTTGFGDVLPKTEAGMYLFMVFSKFWCLYAYPVLVGNIIVAIFKDKNELTHDEQEWHMESLERIAQRLGVELSPQPSDTTHGDLLPTTK